MARRDQPYLPLYVQDFLTDEKLNECSAEATGVYIKIMCVMHKSKKYGTILLKQKDKQDQNICLNFAKKFVKHLPFSEDVIFYAIEELINENVLQLDGDKLSQKRMIKDNETSLKRAKAGKKGGKKTQFALSSAKAKVEATPENENEIVNVYKSVFNYYLTLPLKKHKSYTDSMRDSIKRFMDKTKSTVEECKICLDRHVLAVENTKKNDFPIIIRGIAEFFGQKVYQGTELIAEQYLDGGKYATVKPVDNSIKEEYGF